MRHSELGSESDKRTEDIVKFSIYKSVILGKIADGLHGNDKFLKYCKMFVISVFYKLETRLCQDFKR